jgi:GNAT superfamily N-acetyltransferase
MRLEDLGRVPIGHQGEASEIAARIAALGSSALLAFDGEQHVGQLQFRRHEPGTRSPQGVFDPLYWGDFGMHEPRVPDGAITLYCFHVGQLDDSDARDARYQGRGIGGQLLDALVAWADDRGIPAIVAKAVPPYRPVAMFMGGLPAAAFEERGFATVGSWVDEDLRAVVARDGLAPEGVGLDEAARMSCCVRLHPARGRIDRTTSTEIP